MKKLLSCVVVFVFLMGSAASLFSQSNVKSIPIEEKDRAQVKKAEGVGFAEIVKDQARKLGFNADGSKFIIDETYNFKDLQDLKSVPRCVLMKFETAKNMIFVYDSIKKEIRIKLEK